MKHRPSMPTLRDVAQEAGVSAFTVSAVLNGARSNTRVSPATRQRIQSAARALGYTPNATARSLVRRRTDTIGVIFGPVESTRILTEPYSAAVLQGIIEEAAQQGLTIALFTEPCARNLRDGRTDGLILVAPTTQTSLVAQIAASGMSAVCIAYPSEAHGIPSVDIDNAAGIALAVEHLVGLGHTRIAHLTGPDDMSSARMRRAAFEAACRDRGIAPRPGYVTTGDYCGECADAAVEAFLDLPEPPTALVAANDQTAIAAIQALQQRGVSVPEQFSVIGFDDIPAATYVTPSVSTIGQDVVAIGAHALRLLVQRLQGVDVPVQTHLHPPRLLARGSTAPAPVTHLFWKGHP